MVIVVGLCGFIVLLYSSFCIGLRQWQTRLLFFPDAQLKAQPDLVGLDHQDLWIPVGKAPHNELLHSWWIPARANPQRASTPVVLYLHGNGSNVGDLIDTAQQFHALGVHCLLIDYRGYGLSQGPFPTEDRVYEDAEAAWIYLVENMGFQPQQIVVYGHSLGGAIAIELATQRPKMAGLIVEGSFTSMLDMAKLQGRYQLVPLDWILTQRFESLDKVPSIIPPILFIHGTADTTIPYAMSQALYQAAQSSENRVPNELVLIPNADHNNVPSVGRKTYTQALASFITNVTQPHLTSPSSSL